VVLCSDATRMESSGAAELIEQPARVARRIEGPTLGSARMQTHRPPMRKQRRLCAGSRADAIPVDLIARRDVEQASGEGRPRDSNNCAVASRGKASAGGHWAVSWSAVLAAHHRRPFFALRVGDVQHRRATAAPQAVESKIAQPVVRLNVQGRRRELGIVSAPMAISMTPSSSAGS